MNPLKIGRVTTKNNLFLAPLAGYTDIAFRKLARECGAGLTVTEMVSAKGLCYNSAAAADLLLLDKSETPACVQLFGSEPEFFTRAINLKELAAFDIIDLNMGCPVKKITTNGEGSALMKEPIKAAAVIAAAVKAAAQAGRPVTVKIRAGWDKNSVNAEQIALIAESEGAAAVTVHGRTTAQFYSGSADWDIIGRVCQKLKIPVIGNGDVKSAAEAEEKIKTYGVAGVMIGRGALGNPDIFSGCGGTGFSSRRQLLFRHIEYMLGYFGERYTVTNMRKHLPHYLKGVRGIKEIKNDLNSITSAEVLKKRLAEILEV